MGKSTIMAILGIFLGFNDEPWCTSGRHHLRLEQLSLVGCSPGTAGWWVGKILTGNHGFPNQINIVGISSQFWLQPMQGTCLYVCSGYVSLQIRCLGLSDLIHMHTNVCYIPSIYDIHYFWYYINFVASLWKGEALIKYQAQSVHCRRGGEPFPPKKCLPMRACGRVRMHRYMIIIMTYQ